MGEKTSADVGVIGLAVMGQNLALNMADHGFKVAVFNRTTQVMRTFVAQHSDTPGGLVGCEGLSDLIDAVKTPRKIILLVRQVRRSMPSSSSSSTPASTTTTW